MAKINPNSFYSADALLSRLDINGNKPEIFCVVGNRSSGKTTDFSRKIIDNYFKGSFREVMFIRRYINELKGTAEAFFNIELLSNFFKDLLGLEVKTEKVDTGIDHIFFNGKSFGWVVALNSADKIKKKSNLFSSVDVMFFDEFMPETGVYCSKEIDKLKSIHVSVARGYNQRSRYVPVWMASNLVSIINPYFDSWNVGSRLNINTRFLRCRGLVVEQNFNKEAANAQSSSAFLSAFEDDGYYTQQGVYLNDNISMVEKLTGKMEYICSIKYKGFEGSILLHESDVLYCKSKMDKNFPSKIAASMDSLTYGWSDKSNYPSTMMFIRSAFNRGLFRFENQLAKEAVFKLVS